VQETESKESDPALAKYKRDMWAKFEAHHYMSSQLAPSSTVAIARWGRTAIGFIAVLPQPGRLGLNDCRIKLREHRLVVLPDYQGLGIGTRLSNATASRFLLRGNRYTSKSASFVLRDYRRVRACQSHRAPSHRIAPHTVTPDRTTHRRATCHMPHGGNRAHSLRVRQANPLWLERVSDVTAAGTIGNIKKHKEGPRAKLVRAQATTDRVHRVHRRLPIVTLSTSRCVHRLHERLPSPHVPTCPHTINRSGQ
jgi:GNAT superfamily N-acetyltransferase